MCPTRPTPRRLLAHAAKTPGSRSFRLVLTYPYSGDDLFYVPAHLQIEDKVGRSIWLLICTKVIPGIYNLYLLNIYVFCVFPETKTA